MSTHDIPAGAVPIYYIPTAALYVRPVNRQDMAVTGTWHTSEEWYIIGNQTSGV